MCGFAGFVGNKTINSSRSVLERMVARIEHRGPDDSGVWLDKDVGVSLAHRRLAIMDLSPAGHQPMVSASNRYVIVYNGEIYNHMEIRRELDKSEYSFSWRGHSDTETLLAGIDAWGIEAILKKCVGMFALALWDRKKHCLILARDRVGEKPLYYGWQGEVFLFGSELKALKEHPAFVGEINRNALTLLLRHNYIPSPYSIYKKINKLLPGTILKLEVRNGQLREEGQPEPEPYWSLSNVVAGYADNPLVIGDSEAQEELDRLLRDSIRMQMIADVPLGAFLSGGIDSSTIVALMQAQTNQPIKTFTIGFNEKRYNEAAHAKAIAMHLGTEHTELYVSPRKALDVIPKLPRLYDEPFSDSSQIPTFLVSEMTRQHVTVSLSGDAGDELFGGYNRYFWAKNIWNKIGYMPMPMRKMAVKGINKFSPELLNQLLGSIFRYLPSRFRVTNPGDKAHKLAEILDASGSDEIYWRLVSHWKQPSDVVVGAVEPETVLTNKVNWPKLNNLEYRMMYLDSMSYLPDDILTKVDRAAMGVSLETRIPFLDHRLIEYAWSLPLSMKIRNGQGKWLLRQLLYKYVPKKLIERPKMGFGIPIDSWLRGPLREWAEELLKESRLKQEGFFNPKLIRKKWLEHLSGQRNWQYHLWDVLMFQAWLSEQT